MTEDVIQSKAWVQYQGRKEGREEERRRKEGKERESEGGKARGKKMRRIADLHK